MLVLTLGVERCAGLVMKMAAREQLHTKHTTVRVLEEANTAADIN
jgi:hypothetical protein